MLNYNYWKCKIGNCDHAKHNHKHVKLRLMAWIVDVLREWQASVMWSETLIRQDSTENMVLKDSKLNQLNVYANALNLSYQHI